MENVPYREAFRGSQVDSLASFSNSSNIGVALCSAHGRVDQMISLKVLAHLPAQKNSLDILEYIAYWNFKQGTPVMIFPKAMVMLSICSFKNIGSTIPSHSKVSNVYGMKPLGQSFVGSLRKASTACPVLI